MAAVGSLYGWVQAHTPNLSQSLCSLTRAMSFSGPICIARVVRMTRR